MSFDVIIRYLFYQDILKKIQYFQNLILKQLYITFIDLILFSYVNSHRKLNTSDKTHNIVVVKPAQTDPTADKDPDIVKLQSIPMFLPIMRGTLNLPPGVRDPEVLERLDPVGLFNLCARYQHHLNTNAQITAAEQATLCTTMEMEFGRVLNLAVDRQKRFARFAEQMNKVHELSRQLTRCHSLLNQTLESLETLNNLLPVEERLEPFVWTTG